VGSHLFIELYDVLNYCTVYFMGAVAEVETEYVYAYLNQTFQAFVGATSWANGGNNFGVLVVGSLHRGGGIV
jgi:hypothetical protein